MNRHPLASVLLLVTLTSAAVSQAKPVLVHLSEGVAQGLLMRKVPPAYPPLARQAHVQGKVILKVRISKSGDVVNLRLVSGHPMLAPAAMEAVKQWKYQPYLLYGDPIEADTNVTVNSHFSTNRRPREWWAAFQAAFQTVRKAASPPAIRTINPLLRPRNLFSELRNESVSHLV